MNTLQIIGILLQVVLIFNLLIIVHELGHFLAARWRGLYVEGFGIWFGKPLWKKTINGVTYSLGSIPAGGFVKLPQMAPMEALEGESDLPREALAPISPLDKIIVAFAGPLFSFGLATAFAVVVYIAGRPVSQGEGTTVIGYVMPDSPSAAAGFLPGDKIISVDGHAVSRFGGMGSDSITWRVVRSEGETLPVSVERIVDGKPQRLELLPKPAIPETRGWQRSGMRQISIEPMQTPVVGEVKPGSPAAEADVRPGDRIVSVGGKPLFHYAAISDYLAEHPNGPLSIGLERGGEHLDKSFAIRGATISSIIAGSPAEKAGLKKDDRVIGIDGHPNASTMALSLYIRKSGGQPVTLNIERGGEKQDVAVTPAIPDGEKKPFIGIQWDEDHGGIEYDPRGLTVIDHPRPLAQLNKAAHSIFDTMGAVASRKSNIGVQHMGGPVMMMRAYYSFFEGPFSDGWRRAFWFSVLINVNLAMMNMLPIPVLDGGHITIALLEAIRRRPVSLRILEPVQTACALLVIGFMLFVTFFDVQDLPFFGKDKLKFKPTPSAGAKQ